MQAVSNTTVTSNTIASVIPTSNTIASVIPTSAPETVDLGDQLFRRLEQRYREETGQLGPPVVQASPALATANLPPISQSETYHHKKKEGRGRPRLPKKTVQIHSKQLAMLLGFKMGNGKEKEKKANYVTITGDQPHALPSLKNISQVK